ncbi:hypothetical protein BZL41_06325 [Pseudomonas sp. PIC25]|uniref:DUF6766 family protein n=1 Tax=Pseudomonas sp. PIC25 TaxID=1958773 RepID=UPI000BAB860E|nr:DUF6766 family protein [Pseudomonas sp. PIC25]PAU65471.1 hypothetical protein BZL41_06325 [Pseudomonas sp. PIC25]
MKGIWHRNGLSLSLFGLFLIFQIGLSLVGFEQHNQDQISHQQPTLGYLAYLTSDHFMEATMENWESEFLQMFAYVLLTAYLFQKGSAESRPFGDTPPSDVPPYKVNPDAPWPVRRGGWVLRLYEYSLSIALFALFLLSFVLHAVSGAREFSQEELLHGGTAVTTLEYLGTAQFWFESLQNWQSEFFSIGFMVVLSIFLRQKGSPESKAVDAPHSKTGSE